MNVETETARGASSYFSSCPLITSYTPWRGFSAATLVVDVTVYIVVLWEVTKTVTDTVEAAPLGEVTTIVLVVNLLTIEVYVTVTYGTLIVLYIGQRWPENRSR